MANDADATPSQEKKNPCASCLAWVSLATGIINLLVAVLSIFK